MASKAHDQRSEDDVPWRLIAFDLDDTLYPEVEFVRSGFRAVAQWIGENLNFDPDSTFRELIDLFERGVRSTVFDSWLADHELSSDLIDEMIRVYREHYPRIDTFPGVREMLPNLRRQFRLGLLSDGHLAVQERKLAALDISRQFDAVIFTDRLGKEFWKPSVQPFLELIRVARVNPAETVYVGDNPEKDFLACAQLGIHSIWFRQSTGIYYAQNPKFDGCSDYTVESIVGLTQLLTTGHLTSGA